jgi:4-amino-4-deoxy-L-arabinose transferase-like glycosyltransferase
MGTQQSVDDAGVKKVRFSFTFLASLLILVGQILTYTTAVDENVIVPQPLLLSIVGVLILVWGLAYRPSQKVQAFAARFSLLRAKAWIVSSLALSLLAVLAMVALQQAGRLNYIPVLIFWVFAALCYVAGFSKGLPSVSHSLRWLQIYRYELLGIGLVTLLGLVLRFYRLGEIPRVVNGDEGRVGLAALSTNANPYANPFALWESIGALYLQAMNYLFSLFGVSPFSLRLLPAIGGTLAIPALYLLARQISGHRIALIAASLLAITHTHIHFSRTVAVSYIQGTWLIPLELYFLLSGLIKRNSWRAAIGGILLAVHFNVYLDAQIVAALIVVYMLIAFLFFRSWFKTVFRQVIVFWGGFGIMFLPELVYIWQSPEEFLNRLNENGTFQSGWLAQQMADSGQSAAQVFAERVIHAFLAVIYYPSFDFYGSSIPMLSLVGAMLFLAGLGIALWQTRSPGILLLNGYFWAGTLAIGIFSIPPSADTYRMLIVLPAVLLLAALGLDGLLRGLGLGWVQSRKAYSAVTAVVLLGLFVFNAWAYYGNFGGLCLYGGDSPPTRFASYLGSYVDSIDRESRVYLLSDQTYFYGSHASVDFLSGKHPINNIKESVDTLSVKPDEAIIASPNRIPELRNWAENHPGGVLHYEYDCQQTILLAYQYP